MNNIVHKNILILSLFFSWGLVNAMEERDVSIQEDLPAEINLYMTQFLGSSLAETLKNIATLSQVDKYFHSLITHNPKMIGRILKDRFGDERLKILLSAAQKAESRVIAKLISFGLINSNDIKNIQSILLDTAINDQSYNFLDFLYTINALDDVPSLIIDDKIAVPDGRIVTPLNYVWTKLSNRQETWPIIIKMIKNGANINQIIIERDKEGTPLDFALDLGNIDFFEELLNLGADPTIKDKYGRSVVDSFVGAPSFMRSYIDALEKHGFKVSMRVNNKRGRMFTVQRKKIQHRNRSIARNARQYNHQSV